MFKKFISVFLSLLIACSAAATAFYGFALKSDAAIDFSIGENATWYYDVNTGELSISGTGATYDYDQSSPPWLSYARSFSSVRVGEGITRLGKDVFSTASMNSLYLPSTLETIDCHINPTVANIIIPEQNSLRQVNTDLRNSNWFGNQPDGPVYLGSVLIGYKGEITEDTEIEVKEGTLGIGCSAFYSQSSLAHITFPDSIEYIGERALEGTAWLSSQPYGPLYVGKTLYSYVGNIALEDQDFYVKDGTVSISYGALYSKKGVLNVAVYFPASLEIIGAYSFFNSNVTRLIFADNSSLKEIQMSAFSIARIETPDLPDSLEYIGDLAFSNLLPLLKIPSGVKKIGKLYCTGTSNVDLRTKFEVSPDNLYYSSGDDFYLYNKDKTELIRASAVYEDTVIVAPTVTQIAPGAFRFTAKKNIILPDGITSIGDEAFAYCAYDGGNTEFSVDFGYSEPKIGKAIFSADKNLKSITVRSADLTFPEGAFSSAGEDFTVYLVRNSAMQEYCETYGINYEFIDTPDFYLDDIYSLLQAANGINRSWYTEASAAALDEAVAAVDFGKTNLMQEEMDEWASGIRAALNGLEILPADYTLMRNALDRALAVNRGLYTADSLLELDRLLLSVDYDMDISEQSSLDSLAAEIEAAVGALVYREADYSLVNAAVSRSFAIDRKKYTDASLANLDLALQSVEYGLDITNQSRVDAFADSIELAISALVARAADYGDVDAAVARANAINRAYYTPESLKALDDAVNAVDRTLSYDDYEAVARFAADINSALENLEYLPADYSAVDAAIARTNGIDRVLWSSASLTMLDQSVQSVDRSLNITMQSVVDSYAELINGKIDSLEYAPVSLRNNAEGVVVTSSAKEIYPGTSLSVTRLDPSDISSANFAVGGKVKSALYYDISLIRNGSKVQPDGAVTVKIRIPDGVSADKCKVYHVTDDPVEPLVKFTSSIDGVYIVFETTHFSEFAVIEVETVPEDIAITEQPAKTEYVKGELFDRAGMVVTAYYSDGSHREITDYDVSVDTGSAGTKTLTVYYTFNGVTKSAMTVINVAEPSEDDASAAKTKINLKSSKTVDYKTYVTVTASASDLPEGCSLAMFDGATGQRLKTTGSADSIEYEAGQLKSGKTFIVKAVDKNGSPLKDSSGNDLAAKCEVKVNSGFFTKIVVFIKSLFSGYPTEII